MGRGAQIILTPARVALDMLMELSSLIHFTKFFLRYYCDSVAVL